LESWSVVRRLWNSETSLLFTALASRVERLSKRLARLGMAAPSLGEMTVPGRFCQCSPISGEPGPRKKPASSGHVPRPLWPRNFQRIFWPRQIACFEVRVGLLDDRVVTVSEYCKEEVVMSDAKRMADEAKRMGEEVQGQAQRAGREYQKAAETGLEAASRSFGEANKGFQALAAEMMEYSKAAFDDAIRTWEQLIGVRSLEQAMQIQSDYAKRVYENHMAELKKLGEMTVGMVRDASKPVEDASRRSR
jgi:hypothetical protein